MRRTWRIGGSPDIYQERGQTPQNSINYYMSVADTLGGESSISDSIRLFMAPGMGHCGGGEGPNKFDLESALDTWVSPGSSSVCMTLLRPMAEMISVARPSTTSCSAMVP